MIRLSDKDRALLAGNDAGLLPRLKAALASRISPRQERADDGFGRILDELPRFRELPEYFAWDDLAAEMKANILVGLEAGEVVRSRPVAAPLGWKTAVTFAGIAFLIVSGYWLGLSGHLLRSEKPQTAILEAHPGGLELQTRETALTVIYSRESGQQVLSGGLGGIRADYVDEETGQLTVAHVYAE